MIRFKVQNAEDRERLVLALANSGYTVRIVVKDSHSLTGIKYYVEVFELVEEAKQHLAKTAF